ncbi:MAG: PAS domain-containing sensor histidine kinase [Flavobacterium sp.]|nr:PAS domain-containing sensor histidine kinase [Flavobacterium sp.]
MGKDDFNISRNDLQKVADFLPYPFIIAEIVDGIHLNTYLNEKFSEEIGYNLDEIPTIEAWYEMAYPDDVYREKVIIKWDQEESESRKEGKVFVRMKSQVTCKNGLKRWYEVKATVINSIHIVAFVDLDREIVLQEELKSINQNNDRMLSILGHDLRSPIANLMTLSSMAANAEINSDEFVKIINMINGQSVQVLDLLENTLNWAKLNFNVIEVVPTDIDFRKMIKNILAGYKTACEDKNITVNIDLSDELKVHTDLEILTIIVRNLISNAIKFTPKNGTIMIKPDGNKIIITDTGIGMPSAMIKALLNHNYSSRKGTNNELGTGLGLQLIANLTEKINCKVIIESEEMKGTKVQLIF